ncbi:hypothetical protein DFH07DRAFT_974827 [Mycena maculata]|uniref:Uncharacterized protein n=1 Tax=Mycena maculata TaxID=230809 RepID=A0AAD7H667_9AGAR|nr:hypothetical protein DFH07DRAFT_974827 [Mycena maculata]
MATSRAFRLYLTARARPDLDGYRIVLLQGFLDEDALRWFVTEVDNPRLGGYLDLDFADVMCALHRRYVKSATAQRATREFDTVAWDAEEGPEGLYSALISQGQRMVEMPLNFVLKSRFLKTIPIWVSKEMRLRRGLTVEFSTLESLRSHARQIWETSQGIKAEEAAEARSSGRVDNTTRSPRDTRVAYTRTEAHPAPARNVRAVNLPREPQRDSSRIAVALPPHSTGKKACFKCGGDHFARDPICPKFSEPMPPRDKTPRVAAQRVLESYSDEDTDEYVEPDPYPDYSDEDDDHHRAPDLEALLSESNEEAVRLNAMSDAQGTPRYSELRYYSMRIDESEGPDMYEESDTEDSVTESSVTARSASPAPFGNYNPGPICVVCHSCALVSRQVPATPENGLPTDQEYTVCEHLAGIGLVARELLPDITRESGVGSDGETPLNWLGEPDLPPGVLISIEAPAYARNPLDAVRDHDAARVRAGHPPLTALEFYMNLQWVQHNRLYTDDEYNEQELRDYEEHIHAEMLQDPEFGSASRALQAIADEEDALRDERLLAARGPGTEFRLDAEL